jgi:hypothetical protein
MRSLPQKYAPKSYDQMKKEHDLSDLSPKQIQKVLMKIDEMQDVFLKSAEHEKKPFLTSASSWEIKLL